MNLTNIHLTELRESMSDALDLVLLQRVGNGQSIESERMTRIRESFEDRIVKILEETDETAMPDEWSWQEAAKALSWLMAMDMICPAGLSPPEHTGLSCCLARPSTPCKWE